MLKLGNLDPRSPRDIAGRQSTGHRTPACSTVPVPRGSERAPLFIPPARLGEEEDGMFILLFSGELVRRDDPTPPHPISSIPGLLSHSLADLVLPYPLITTTAELQTPFRTSSMQASGLPAVLETSSTGCNASYPMGDTDTKPSDLLVSSNLSQLDHSTQITPL